jgi:hypothetical protein
MFTGAWPGRITDEHRLVYLVEDNDLVILQARFNYTRAPVTNRQERELMRRA